MANCCIAGPEDYPRIHRYNRTLRASFRELVTRCFAEAPVAGLSALRAQGRLPARVVLYDAPLTASVRQHHASNLALYQDCLGTADLLFPR